MQKITSIFFDLDGTLTDPREGIERCFRYALARIHRPFPAGFGPEDYIGPPLRTTFARQFGQDETDLIEEAVALYRERFAELGLFENEVYPGVPALLSSLYDAGSRLFVATTKPTVYAQRIMEHFSLSQWFGGVFGTELDGRFDDKADLLRHILLQRSLLPEETVMVGDRRQDIVAGKANKLATIGVTYGYGSESEIHDSSPDFICSSPEHVLETVTRLHGDGE